MPPTLSFLTEFGKIQVDYSWNSPAIWKVQRLPTDDIQVDDQITSSKNSRIPIGRVSAVHDDHFIIGTIFHVKEFKTNRTVERLA